MGRMTILASVQTAQDGSMSWGIFLTMLGAVVLLLSPVAVAWYVAHLEDRTRYDEVEDSYPAERIPAGRSWK